MPAPSVTWPLGSPPPPFSTPLRPSGSGAVAQTFGVDIAAYNDLDPTMALASGSADLRQAILHRVTTPRGTLFYDDPHYGIDLRDFLNTEWTTSNQNNLIATVTAELLKEERILSVNITVLYAPTTRQLTLTGAAVTASGPFSFVLVVSQVDVTILQNGNSQGG